MLPLFPAFDYEQPGLDYASLRQGDPRIAARVEAALGKAGTVLNVGAGAGSYEPADRYVVAIEPSAAMRRQRQAAGMTPAIDAHAAALPFDEGAFDAAMAIVTVHHWPDRAAGLAELRRVTRNQVLIMTFDPEALGELWISQYFPELIEVERRRMPPIPELTGLLGGSCEVQCVPVPTDCRDGFQEAYYGRPEAFLQPEVRKAQSAWGFLPGGQEETMVQRLADDLTSGAWDRQYGHFRNLPEYSGSLRLIIGRP